MIISETHNIRSSFCQGLVLGSFLFLIFINNLPSDTESEIQLFPYDVFRPLLFLIFINNLLNDTK